MINKPGNTPGTQPENPGTKGGSDPRPPLGPDCPHPLPGTRPARVSPTFHFSTRNFSQSAQTPGAAPTPVNPKGGRTRWGGWGSGEGEGEGQTSTPGSLARAFGVHLLDPDECRKAVISFLHPAGAKCPGCGERIEGDKAHRFAAGERVTCGSCGKRFSFVTGTCLSGSHLDPRALVLLAFLTAEGFKVGRMAEILNLDRSTVRAWKEKLTEMTA